MPAPDGFLFLDMAFEGLVARVREKSFHGLHGIRGQYCEPCDFGGDKIVERFVIGNAGDDAHVERFGSGDRLGEHDLFGCAGQAGSGGHDVGGTETGRLSQGNAGQGEQCMIGGVDQIAVEQHRECVANARPHHLSNNRLGECAQGGEEVRHGAVEQIRRSAHLVKVGAGRENLLSSLQKNDSNGVVGGGSGEGLRHGVEHFGVDAVALVRTADGQTENAEFGVGQDGHCCEFHEEKYFRRAIIGDPQEMRGFSPTGRCLGGRLRRVRSPWPSSCLAWPRCL